MADLKLDFSIIVCCYNSAARLPETLRHIAAQNVPENLGWEVVVVDNASKDNTFEVAEANFLKYPGINFKIVSEQQPGLSSARNKGVSECRGAFVLFCDDDNWLDPDYLQTAHKIMLSDPKIGMLGGIGEAFVEGKVPEWFDKQKITYAVGPQNPKEGDISYTKGFVYGAGSVIRKALLAKLNQTGFKHVLTDRIGKKMVSGGDNELGYAIVIMGYKIYYSPQLRFRHYIPQNRLNKEYLSKIQLGQVYTSSVIRAYEDFIRNKTLIYKPLTYKFLKKNIKKTARLTVDLLQKKISGFDYYLQTRKAIAAVKYFLTSRNADRQNFYRVKNNIESILKSNS